MKYVIKTSDGQFRCRKYPGKSGDLDDARVFDRSCDAKNSNHFSRKESDTVVKVVLFEDGYTA